MTAPDHRPDAVARAIARLSPLRRHILRLHRGKGLTYAEIAERLSISTDKVEQHMAIIILAIHRACRPRRRGVVQSLRRWLGLVR